MLQNRPQKTVVFKYSDEVLPISPKRPETDLNSTIEAQIRNFQTIFPENSTDQKMTYDENKSKFTIKYNKGGSHFYLEREEIEPDVVVYLSTKAPEKLGKDQFKSCVKKLYGNRKKLTQKVVGDILNRPQSGVSESANDK